MYRILELQKNTTHYLILFVALKLNHVYHTAGLNICPPFMIYKNITCQLTCEDPRGSKSCRRSESVEYEACGCPDGLLSEGANCVRPSQCGCYLTEANIVIPVRFSSSHKEV